MGRMTPPTPAPRLSDVAYGRILEALFSRKVVFGSFVSQGELCEVTGMSVGPLRDALRLLEADGILRIHPRSGIEVVRPSTELARNTYQFRSMIEGQGARQFALTAKPQIIEALIAQHNAWLGEHGQAGPEADLAPTLARVEDDFHGAVVASLANPIVEGSYRRLQLLARIVRMDGVVTFHTAALSINEHLNVLTAARSRNPEMAEAAMTQHLANALRRNLGLA
ncbi:GntR family transcriptional regulator [Rubellimicrobium arenae]|uniref:GntR family transcriptional regulator n=1 Tax=Rubellimicrobium arenae TaxID=2817372 RepID=UPI001B3048B7|nr:GntR family transcriptional regulator [Rubellimicrobium arenae]